MKAEEKIMTDNHWVRRVDTTGIISLYAGTTNNAGDPQSGNTGLALEKPYGVFAATAPARIYIADTENNRVVNVTPAGMLTVVAGTGSDGYSGDGGSATSAKLSKPRGVFLASSGVLFIADRGNHSVRTVSTSGIITTVAGNGSDGYSGDGGPATAAKMSQPRAVFVDAAGNLFLVDENKNRLRVVSHFDGIIRTLAGTGSNGNGADGVPAAGTHLATPCGLTMDKTRGGRCIYVGDRSHNRVRTLRWKAETDLY